MTGSLGTVAFNSDGILVGAAADPPTTTEASTSGLDWGNGTTPTEILVTFDTTQFNSESAVISQNQNGSRAGNLTGIAIDPEGIVVASYSNGEQTKVSHSWFQENSSTPAAWPLPEGTCTRRQQPPVPPVLACPDLNLEVFLPTLSSSQTSTWGRNLSE